MAHLVIRPGDGTTSTRPIESDRITLGSGPLNSVVLPTAPPGCQAEITLDGDTYRFRNVGAAGTATLNYIAVTQGTLRGGDTLRFGPVECVFHASAPAAAASGAGVHAAAPTAVTPPPVTGTATIAPPPVPMPPAFPPPSVAVAAPPASSMPPSVPVHVPAPPPVAMPPPVPAPPAYQRPAPPPPVAGYAAVPPPPPVPATPPGYAPPAPPPANVTAALPPVPLPSLAAIAPLPTQDIEAAARVKPGSYFAKLLQVFRAAVREAKRRAQLSTLDSRLRAARETETPRALFHVGLAARHAGAAPGTLGAHYAGIADLESRLVAARKQVLASAQRGVAQDQGEVAAYEGHLRNAFTTLGAAAAGGDRAALPPGLLDPLLSVENAVDTLQRQHTILTADATSRAELSELLGELRHETAAGFRHAGTHLAGMIGGDEDAVPGEAGPALPDRVTLKERLTVGRDPRNDVVLPGRDVSQSHLEIVRQADGGYLLRDLFSTNGTFLNGQRITAPAPIRDGDRLRVGATTFALHDGALLPSSEKNNTRITVQDLTKTVQSLDTKQPLNLLENVNLVIEPKEFVALLGPSGSGKSTFMDAINGRRRATGGRVLVNDDDFYESYQYYRRAIGYVPQQDIVHTSLTVKQALRFSAQMRLPADTSRREIEAIIDSVIKKLGLAERAQTRISNLSGGQLKRVSLGVELISDPSLLFLDEATSGLDAGTESKMMTLFRKIADDGTTVVCITHNVENVSICNMVVVLVRGRLTYYGPPADMPGYFGVAKISDVYDVLEGQTAEQWAARYEASELHRKYVAGRMPARGVPLAAGAPPPVPGALPAPPPVPAAHRPPPVPGMPPIPDAGEMTLVSNRAPASPPSPADATLLPPRGGQSMTADLHAGRDPRQTRTNFFRQYQTLRRRYTVITLQDRKNLLILLAQAPIIALLVGMVFFNHGAKDNQLVIFLMIISAVWFGCSNAAKEIVKELPIYKRERAINLEILTYLLSKVTVLSVLCAAQCFALVAIILPLTGAEVGFIGSLCVIYLTSLASMMMGLVVSAFVDNTDKANAVTPLLLIPQVIFAGAIIALDGPALFLGRLFIVSFWAFDAMCHLAEGFVREPKQNAAVDIFVILLMLAAFGYLAIWGLRRKDVV